MDINMPELRGAAEELGIDLDDASNSEYEVARAHLVRPADTLEILDDQGRQVWNVRKFDFLKDPQVPATVNPSLWVHAKSDRLADCSMWFPTRSTRCADSISPI